MACRQHAALITSGLVKVTLPSARARSCSKAGLLLSIRGPGDLVGEETAIREEVSPAGAGYSSGRFMVAAIRPGSARVFFADHLRRYLTEHPAALWSVAAGLCERLTEAEDRIASAARDNADCRLARLLCDLERHGIPDYNSGPGPQIPLSFARPSSPPGSAHAGRPSNRTLTRWRRRRIISTRSHRSRHDLKTLAASLAFRWPPGP